MLDAQAFMDCPFPLRKADCPDDMGDRWLNDHIGTVVIRCKSQAGQM